MAHHILIEHLEKVGIGGIPNNLIRSYLTRQHQCVNNAGELSNKLEEEFGVPQGRVVTIIV